MYTGGDITPSTSEDIRPSADGAITPSAASGGIAAPSERTAETLGTYHSAGLILMKPPDEEKYAKKESVKNK